MSVCNGAPFLRPAIESILHQTFDDFEFIIIDDGSTDESPNILDSYHDPRVVRLKNDIIIGLTASLNRGLAIASGEFIARQDADDLSHPQRLEKELGLLQANDSVGLVGSDYVIIDADGVPINHIRLPTHDVELQETLLVQNCFVHGGTMFRTICLELVGTYDETFKLSQDYDLWLRIGDQFHMANLPEVLYYFRQQPSSLSATRWLEQRKFARQSVENAIHRRVTRQGLVSLTKDTARKVYFNLACAHLAEGNLKETRRYLVRSFETGSPLNAEHEYMIDQLANWGLQLYRATSPDLTDAQRIGAGADYLHKWFECLPSNAKWFKSQQRRALAKFYIVLAFFNYQQGVFCNVPRNCLRGLWYDPSWLGNRGVLAIWWRSLKAGI